jgi:hypothetical protein
MSNRFKNYEHVFRMAGLFLAGVALFLVARAILVPKDFGRYGFYRPAALDDIKAQKLSFAGHASCAECHGEIVEMRIGTRHEKVNCESCHGPLATHVSGDVMNPGKPDLKTVCVPCHKKMDGRPKFQPQVDFNEHSGDALCTDCHKPHSPKIQQ